MSRSSVFASSPPSRRVAAFAASALLAAAAAAQQQDVTIYRETTHGIAHVYSPNDRGAFYGAGYAAAEDRLFQMHLSRLQYRGRLAEYFGAGTGDETRLSDLGARVVGWTRTADAAYAGLQPENQELLDYYAQGVNDYVASSGAVVHPLFATYGIPVEPWTAQDCLGVYYVFMSKFQDFAFGEAEERYGLDAYLATLPQPTNAQDVIDYFFNSANMMDDGAAAIRQSDVPVAVQTAMQTFATSKGVWYPDPSAEYGTYTPFSEAFAVHGSKIDGGTGKSVLVGLPRVGVKFPSLFHELHMSGRSFNVRGACIPGTPFILSGSSSHCAWSPTKLNMDQTDLFRLPKDPAHADQYSIDGAWYDWEVDDTDPMLVKLPNGGLSTEYVRYRSSTLGPIATQIVGAAPDDEFALHGPPFTTTDLCEFEALLAMYRATTSVGFYNATADWMYPSLNLVFAAGNGTNGSIGYAVVGGIPVRKANQPAAGRFALDGSSSANHWQSPFFAPNDVRPRVINPASGFVYSANHLPIGSWYPLKSLVPGSGDTGRSRILRDLLERQPSFTEAELEALVVESETALTRDLADLGKYLRTMSSPYSFSAEATAALDVLLDWRSLNSARMDAGHHGVAVAQFVNQAFFAPDPALPLPPGATAGCGAAIGRLNLMYGAREAGMSLWLREELRAFSVLSECSHSAAPCAGSTDTALAVEYYLANAWQEFQAQSYQGSPLWQQSHANWIAWYVDAYLDGTATRWSEVPGQPPLQHCPSACPVPCPCPIAFGVATPLSCVFNNTLGARRQILFNQFVPLRNPDESKSLITFGESEHDGNPYQTSQQAVWEQDGMKASPILEATVATLCGTPLVLPIP